MRKCKSSAKPNWCFQLIGVDIRWTNIIRVVEFLEQPAKNLH